MLFRAKYTRVRLRPRATRMQPIEQHAQTTNTIPVEDRILPIPTNGETIPPAAKHTWPVPVRKIVGGYRPGDDDTSRTGYALQQTEGHKLFDILSKQA